MSTDKTSCGGVNRLEDIPTSKSNGIDFHETTTDFKEETEITEIVLDASDCTTDVSKLSGLTPPKSYGEIECLEVIDPCPNFGVTPMEENVMRRDDITELPIETTSQGTEGDKRSPTIESENNEPGKPQNNVNTTKNKATGIEVINVFSCLSSLALEYASSDSDEEKRAPSPCETITIVEDRGSNAKAKTQYRSKLVNGESESEDTHSESGSDISSSGESTSSDSDSVSELEDNIEVRSKARPSKAKQTKSEFDDLPPIEELKITVPEELCDRLGKVSGIVEQLVIVRPISGKPTLNLDSILFLEKGRRVLGQVFDVFGQVAEPNYCVRFNNEEQIKQSGIVMGMEVYYSPNTEHTSLVFLHELVKLKGVDVSGDDDVEPPEFSDDEEERAYNQLQRQKQRQKPGENANQENLDIERIPQKRQCHDWPRNPWSSNWRSQSYNNPRSRWNAENSQSPFRNQFNLQNPANSSNQSYVDQYGQSIPSQYQFNPYGNSYQQNNLFPPSNPGYAFGRSPGFRPNVNNYEPHLYRPNRYPQSSMSWTPPPPPPPPPST